jgi:hypothetical protein
MGPVDPTAVILDETIALCANDIGHLEEWPGHFFFSLGECWMLSRLETERVFSFLSFAAIALASISSTDWYLRFCPSRQSK